MKKYWSIFKISLQQEFAYKVNFLLWRVRNIFQIVVVFYFWSAIFTDSNKILFNYDRAKMLTYVFAILVIRAVVLSARTVDLAGQIANGDLANLLLKPLSQVKYWFCRDLSSKILNLFFSVWEILILYLILKPPLFIQTNFYILGSFIIFLFLAVLLFYYLLFAANLFAFWMPENGWAFQFLFIAIITEFLSGGVFPMDIFPGAVQRFFNFLPFQYLLYFPIQVYLGKVSTFEVVRGLLVAVFWLIFFYLATSRVWRRGIKNYAAEGR